MTALNTAQPIFLQQKSTQLHKQKHPSQALFPPGTYFMPHINVAKTDLFFVNTFCAQTEEFPPIFKENQKNHPIQINRGIIGYAMCDITEKPIQRYNIKNCAKFTNTILKESEDYNSCFILNTVVSNLQERQQIQSNSCIRHVDFRTQSIFDSNMPIAHTISSDAEMRKGFANTISKIIPLLMDYRKSRNCDIGDIITFRADNNLVYNLIIKASHYEKPTTDTIRTTLLAMRDHAVGLNLCCIAMPNIACGLDGMDWRDISSLIEQTIKNSGITICVYTSKDDIDKLQKVETNTLEQEEVLEII